MPNAVCNVQKDHSLSSFELYKLGVWAGENSISGSYSDACFSLEEPLY